MKRKWRRKDRVYRFDSAISQSIIFGAHSGLSMWAWGVWGSKFSAEGIEFSLQRAKTQANKHLDVLLEKEKP